jgi:hypothetical protein
MSHDVTEYLDATRILNFFVKDQFLWKPGSCLGSSTNETWIVGSVDKTDKPGSDYVGNFQQTWIQPGCIQMPESAFDLLWKMTS